MASLQERGVRIVVLQGKTALVTGASRGIGRAVARALGAAGADVALLDIGNQQEAAETVETIRASGRRAMFIETDVGDNAAVERAVGQVVSQFGRLDIAVTNAAYSDRAPFYEADLDGFHRTVQVTMWGAFYTMRAATRQMIAQGGGGSIVIVSSPHAFQPVPRAMAYNMAKAAIDSMGRTAAIELVDHRIRVNLIHPGWTDTPGERKYASEETIQKAAGKLPWGRMGRPDEVARGVLFFCDPASDYITGSSLGIDGGITLPWWASRGSAVPE